MLNVAHPTQVGIAAYTMMFLAEATVAEAITPVPAEEANLQTHCYS